MKKLDSMPRNKALSTLDSMIKNQEQAENYGKIVSHILNSYSESKLTESERENRRENWTLGDYLRANFFNKIIRRTIISGGLSWILSVLLCGIYTVAKGESTDNMGIGFAILLILSFGGIFVFAWCSQWIRPSKKQQEADNDSATTAENQSKLRDLYDTLSKYQKAYEETLETLNKYYSTYYTKDKFKDSYMLKLLRKHYTHPSQTIREAIAECEAEEDARASREYYTSLQRSIESELQETRKSMESYAQKQLDEQRRANDIAYQRNEYERRIEDHLRYGG